MNSQARQHVLDCAEEVGVEFPFDPPLTQKETIVYRGLTIESYYDEDKCQWEAFCKGFGSRTSWQDRSIAIDRLKALMDSEEAV